VFYDSYVKICEIRGISPTRVLNELKISKSSFGHWKAGGEPLNETKKLIASYFDITVSELTSGEIKEKPATNESDGLSDIDKEIMDVVKQLSYERKELLLAQAKGLEHLPK